MKLRTHGLAAIATALLASSSFAQISFPETEPNSQKSEATLVTGIVSGDTIDGTTTGSVTTLTSTLITTADVFRVKTGPLALGIYKHRLTLTTTGTAGHTGTIRGVSQTGAAGTASTGGTATTTDAAVQTSSTTTTPARFNQWYGFGKQEEIYYRVTGSTTTTAAYVSTLTTTPIVATVIPGSFESANPITITTVGQTTTDTFIHVFDGNLDAIPGYSNDDEAQPGTTAQSKLVRTYAPGTYYIAVGTENTAWNYVFPPDDDWATNSIMDFPGSLVRASTSTVTTDFDFVITGSNGSASVSNLLPAGEPYGVTWHTFTVALGAPPVNDNCASASDVSAGGTFGAALSVASNDGVASCDPGGLASKDVWYKFTTNSALCAAKTLTVDTCTSVPDTTISLWSSCGGTELACNDDFCGTASSLTYAVNPGVTVFIRVSDKGLGGGDAVLHVSSTSPVPTNDMCTTPTIISAGTYCFDTTLATTGPEGQGLTIACTTTASPKKDLWYSYTPTSTGTAIVTDCGLVSPASTSQDTKFVVYSGPACPLAGGTGFACNDDTGAACVASTLNSTLSFSTTCGVTYLIQIGNFSSTTNIVGAFSVSQAGPSCSTPSTAFCFGDGTDTACPCGINGTAGRGCENTFGTGGASISSSGVASISADTLVLSAANLGAFQFGLYFEGSATANPTAPFGVVFGNGVRCVNFTGANRLEIRQADGAGASSTTVPLSIPGFAVAGTTYYYQLWYRDGVPPTILGTCNPTAGFNFSHALSLTWGL